MELGRYASNKQTGGRLLVQGASLIVRMLTGLLDLALVAGVTTAIFVWSLDRWPLDFPPRYWNQIDYLVDLIYLAPEMILRLLVVFVGVFVVANGVLLPLMGAMPFARMAGIRIIANSGRRTGPLRAIVRAILALLFGVFAMIGPAFGLVSPRRRMLHDIITGCHAISGPVPPMWRGFGDRKDEIRSRSAG